MIVPMKKLTLAALERDREPLLKALQSACAVQLIPAEEGKQPAESDAVQRLQSAEELLRPFAKKEGLGPKPEATGNELEKEIQPALQLCGELEGLSAKLQSFAAELKSGTRSLQHCSPGRGLQTRCKPFAPPRAYA